MLDNDKSSYNYGELIELYNRNKFQEIIDKIDPSVIDSENDPRIHNIIAASYLNLGNSEQAIMHYGTTVSLDPDNYDALINLANIKFNENEYQLSFNLFAKASKDEKIESQFLAKMGMCLFKLNHLDDAVTLCEEAISADPNCETAYFFLAEMMEKIEDPETAINYYYKAIKQNPNSFLAHLLLGNFFFKLGVYATAIKFYKKTNIINPTEIEPLFKIALMMSKLGKYEEEIFYLKKIIDIDNQNSQAFNLIGLALIQLQQYEEANERFLDAIYLNPDYAESYANLGNNLIKLGKLNDAYECLHKSLEINSKEEKAYIGLDKLHLITNDYFQNQKIFTDKFYRLNKKTIKDFLKKLNLTKFCNQDTFARIMYGKFTDIIDVEPKASIEPSKNIVALLGFGRSGSLFLHSLFDGHPEISTLPGYFFKGWFNEKTWPLIKPDFQEANWRETLAEKICNYFEPQFDASSKKNVIGRPNDHTEWFAQNLGFTQLGDEQSEILQLDQDTFKKCFINLLQSYDTINNKDCFEFIHQAFDKAYRNPETNINKLDKPIFYHIHNPSYFERANFNYHYPNAKSLFIVRHPIQMLESWIMYDLKQLPTLLEKGSSFENNYELTKVLQASNKIPYALQYFLNPLNVLGSVKGVKLEDIKNNPKITLGKITQWIGIQNDESLYKSEFVGKKFSRPSENFNNISGFDTSSIDVPLGRVFGEKDLKILETLFWPFMNLYQYTQMSEEDFLQNLKIIKPWLTKPFEFEKNLHRKLPNDTPKLEDIASLQSCRRYLNKIWEILEKDKSYPYLIEPLT